MASECISGSTMDNVLLLTGNSNPELAKKIFRRLGKKFSDKNTPSFFANGEVRVRIYDNLRGRDVFIIQSGCANSQKQLSINDIILETLLLVDACRRSMAASVNIILPNFPYSRGDKKDIARSPIAAKLVCNLLSATRIDRLVSVDLHSTQIQGFIDIPFDNLYSIQIVKECLDQNLFRDKTVEQCQQEYILVSPDAGATKRTLCFAEQLKLNTLILHKQRNYELGNSVEKSVLIEMEGSNEYSGKTAIICDDIADTCGTLISAIHCLGEYGITKVICIITHGVFSKDGLQKINNCAAIEQFYVSDSIPQEDNMRQCSKLKVFTLSSLLSEVITRIITKQSISTLFEDNTL